MSETVNPVEFVNGQVVLLDQTKIPCSIGTVACKTWREVKTAISDMIVRGAPAIGVTAAFGMVLALAEAQTIEELAAIGAEMKKARPTAVNLAWAVDRILTAARKAKNTKEMKKAVLGEAIAMRQEDIETNRAIGKYGADLAPYNARILTHCNAGALATTGYGTALGVIRTAHQQGKVKMVYADETRPRLQGGKLTAWELAQENIPVTVIADNMAGHLMKKKQIDMVVVGADRIAANGDTANKIGTYAVAVLAKEHGVPFYVAAPFSSIDSALESGDGIPIEERPAEEMTHLNGQRIVAEGAKVINPAFDVTPAGYIAAIITEKGIIKPPYDFR